MRSSVLENLAQEYANGTRASKKPMPVGWIILATVLALAGAGFWYYFFGKKPRVVLTVALPALSAENFVETAMWPIGEGEVLVLAGQDLKMVSLADREVKWTAKMPAPPAVNAEARAAMNSRFVKLQLWADALTLKRATLKTPEETKEFNEEAAKYQEELAASRAAAAKSATPAPPAPAAKPPVKAAPVVAKPKTDEEKPKLNPVVTPEMQLIEARMGRRQQQITKLASAIQAKKAKAKTEIQLSVVADDERRLAVLNAEQASERDQLAQLQGKNKPVVQRDEDEDEEDMSGEDAVDDYAEVAEPFAAVSGDNVWLVDADRMASFERATGKLKADVALAGPMLNAWETNGEIYVIASAGREARQITKITAGANPISLYVPVSETTENATEMPGPEMRAGIEAKRTEFSGQFLRADIKLVEKKIKTVSTIAAGSDQAAIDQVNNSAARSPDELEAIMKLLSNDGKRLAGETQDFIDESTYEVTLTRPMATGTAEWKGQVSGRVELFSTSTLDLISAGTKLHAFDRANRKLWEATLGAPLPRQEMDEEVLRVIEAGDRLYFADGAFLTAFEAPTGKVLWRVPSIGIRKLQLDENGTVYVHSLNLPTEALSSTYDDLGEINTVTMKIDAGSGEIKWKEEKFDDLWVSGNDIYVLKQGKRLEDIEEQVFTGKMQVRVKLYKLSGSTGRPIWEWFQPRYPQVVHAKGKTVGLLFDEELQVLHSIAW